MIASNLKYLRHKKQVSQQQLSDTLGIPRTTLGDYERGKTEPNVEMLIKLSECFDVKIDDLLRKNLSHLDYEILRNKDFRILAISVDKENRGNIELVDTKAEAGYLDSFQDPEYIRDLPKIHFPSIPEGTFRGFEIRGDSMLPIEPGSIVICSYVEHLSNIRDEHTYIVVSKNEGLVYKRLRKDEKNKQLILSSDNESYLPYTIDFAEIEEVWQYFAHLSFSDSKLTFNYLLEEKLSDMQRKINDVHSKVCETN
jgi:transcriptional regulator with XRE-family HTH domain